MDKWLDRLSNAVLVVLAVALVYVLVFRNTSPAPRSTPYRAGDAVNAAALRLRVASLVIATRSSCRFCTASVPFYQTIVRDSTDPDRIIWVAVGESIEENRRYLGSHGINAGVLVSAKETGLVGFTSTPTILLVDPTGRVRHVWRGKLPPDQEAEVRSALAGL